MKQCDTDNLNVPIFFFFKDETLTEIDVGHGVLIHGCLVHVAGYEVQGVRVQGGGGRPRQVQARRTEKSIINRCR